MSVTAPDDSSASTLSCEPLPLRGRLTIGLGTAAVALGLARFDRFASPEPEPAAALQVSAEEPARTLLVFGFRFGRLTTTDSVDAKSLPL